MITELPQATAGHAPPSVRGSTGAHGLLRDPHDAIAKSPIRHACGAGKPTARGFTAALPRRSAPRTPAARYGAPAANRWRRLPTPRRGPYHRGHPHLQRAPRRERPGGPAPPPGLAGTFRGAGAQPRQRSRIPATLVRPLPLLGGTSARPFMIMNDSYRYSRFFLHSEIYFDVAPMSFEIMPHMCLRNREKRGLNPNLPGIRSQEPRPAADRSRDQRAVSGEWRGRPVRPLHGRRAAVRGGTTSVTAVPRWHVFRRLRAERSRRKGDAMMARETAARRRAEAASGR